VFHLRAKAGPQATLGSASVIFTATHPKAGAKLSTDLSVRPASAFVTLVQSGTAIGAGELKSQLDAYPNFAKSELDVSATPWSFASSLMQYLEAYPYGCTEQLTSRILPTIVLSSQPALARALAHDRNGAAFDPKPAYDAWIAQLRARQQADGGIALWPGASYADDYITAYALLALVEARDRKLPVPQDLVSRANVYLQGRLGSAEHGDWRTQTLMAYVLVRQGVAIPAALTNLRRTLDADTERRAKQKITDDYAYASDLGSAYLAASFQIVHQDKTAQDVEEPVWRDFATRTKAGRPRTNWGWYYDPLAHDAMVLYLATHHFPQRLQGLPASTWDTLAKSIGQGWYSTQSTAATLLAVDGYAQAAAAAAQGQLKASTVDAAGKAQPLPLVGELRTMASAQVPPATARVKLANGGDLPLFYGWAQSGYERNLPDTASYHGIEITHVVLDAHGAAITRASIGDEVTVKVTVRALDRDNISQVALVDVLPAGLEPVLQPDGPDVDTSIPAWRRRIGGTGSWAVEYADVREDRVIFFGNIDRTAREITYKARATNTGQFSHPAAYAEAMYERRLFGRSVAGRFDVVPLGNKP